MTPPVNKGSSNAKNVAEHHTLTAADLAASLLRREILAGQHYSGEQLRETHIAARLGLSRNTIREAYRKLEAEGLVTHIPHRGVYVAKYDVSRIRELYAFRRVTECGTICSLSDAETRQLAEKLKSIYSQKNTAMAADRNNAFHCAIVGASGSPELTNASESIFAQLRLCFLAYPDSDALHNEFEQRHSEIIEALEQGDSKTATSILEQYLEDSFATLREALSEAKD